MKEILPKGRASRIQLEPAGKAQQDHVRIRRTLADLPLPAKQMNAISAVCLYSLIGLSDRDIAEALGIDTDRVGRMKMLDAYEEVYKTVTKSIIDNDAEDVRNYFAANARGAAGRMVELSEFAENEGVKLKANQDLLDRAGHRPADVVEVRGRLDSTLQVVYVGSEDTDPVTIDGEAIQTD